MRVSRQTTAALCLAVIASSLGATRGLADSDACRDWRVEHREWKIEALQAFLRGRPRAAQDETLFEVLQREAYLTSCDPEVGVTRADMIGWRLVGRSTDEYPVVLTESVLAAAGFDLELRGLEHALGPIESGRPRRGPRSLARQAAPNGLR